MLTLDLTSFDTSKVTTMREMFGYCCKITRIDLSSFNTSEVKSMYQMFYNCRLLDEVLVNKDTWSTSQADITKMFDYAGTNRVTPKT